ncbi:ATP-dependent DNA ligase [Isoptericola variabilis]|uniref:Probable DNA ligase n=1 Tax=Isoptericola variabilis (strain 225) TaxID=743718 RepID=F6FSM3_ISOV2|nr:ATP-dependent DNA ligase [Isoptericola variabilis]AEG45185.1 DNA ligase [Isoptericola variabilis 225]TWH34000.1 DNA ligase-1 [Isoptericola variabilis J7]
MLLAEVVRTHAAVAATRSRLRKRELLADALRAAEPGEEVEVVASFLSGRPRQRRTGVGWRSLAELPPAAVEPTLTPLDVDDALEDLSRLAGAGSQAARAAAVAELFTLATADEQDFLRRLMLGELRQGALDSLLLDAIAAAADVPLKTVRRAAMFSALSGPIARAALTGGAAALEDFRLEVGRPVRPMLASSAPDVAAALERFGGATVAADLKLDGIRVQVHKSGRDVAVFTRSLDDVTERLPEVVELARSLDAVHAVLDGEAIALDDAGRPRPFQETIARTGSHDAEAHAGTTPLTAYFFDVLHLDGSDLVDAPARERLEALERAVPPAGVVPRRVTADAGEIADFFAETVAAGHEGLVIKDLDAPYEAGRRGAAWVKVKPRHTLDLVVLAVEQGSGRRQGWLSNIHLGARDPATGGFVLLGKTFKGMTDEMLEWQTKRFTELETHRSQGGQVVHVRPEQVVEIAFDGIQRSSRYPGGVALRFARVLRYRDDKTADEADTIDTVRSLAGLG